MLSEQFSLYCPPLAYFFKRKEKEKKKEEKRKGKKKRKEEDLSRFNPHLLSALWVEICIAVGESGPAFSLPLPALFPSSAFLPGLQ